MFISARISTALPLLTFLALAGCGGPDAGLADTESAIGTLVLEGQVIDVDGPLAEVYVRASDRAGAVLARTRTDSNGRYTMQLTAWPYALEVKAFEHVPRLYRSPALVRVSSTRRSFDVHVGPVAGADTTAENITYHVLEDASGLHVVPQIAWGTGGSLEQWLTAPDDLLVGPRDHRLATMLPDGVRLPSIENSVAVRRDHLEVRFSSQLNNYNLGSAYFAAMVDQIAATVSHNFSHQALPVRISVACTTCPGGFTLLRDGVVGPTGPNASYRVNPPHWDRAFTDTAGHRYAAHLAMAKGLGIATGYRDGSDRPDTNVTRAEVAAMLVEALDLALVTPTTPSYRDVPASHWAYARIETARAKNLISGGADGNFRPNGTVTRGELAGFVVNAAGWTTGPLHQMFADVPPTYWAYRRIATAYGWCHAVDARSWSNTSLFEPAVAATRAEAIAAMVRMLGCLVGNEVH